MAKKLNLKSQLSNEPFTMAQSTLNTASVGTREMLCKRDVSSKQMVFRCSNACHQKSLLRRAFGQDFMRQHEAGED